MSKLFVTGAAGFIGSHLCEHLIKRGHSVTAFVRYNSRGTMGWLEDINQDAQRQINIITGDIRDGACVEHAMQGCDAVFHLAALIGIPYSYRAPQSYVDTNVTGTVNVMQAARKLGVGRVMQTSTSEVYGTALRVPIDEEHPLQGQSPYSASKIASDQMALSFYRSFDVPVAVVRPFNTFGPRQSRRAVIPTIIAQALANDGPIRLGSLHPTRDFTFVTDLAAAFTAFLDAPDSVLGSVTNVGSGFEISIGDVVDAIGKIVGRPLDVITEDTRIRPDKSEVERLWADISLANDRLDWSPEFGGQDGFLRGLERTVAWFKANPEKPSILNPVTKFAD